MYYNRRKETTAVVRKFMKRNRSAVLITGLLFSLLLHVNAEAASENKASSQNWKSKEITRDLDKDGKKDKLVVDYLEKDGKVYTKYTPVVNGTKGTSIEKIFDVENYGEQFEVFTKDYIENYERTGGKAVMTTDDKVPDDLMKNDDGQSVAISKTKEETTTNKNSSSLPKGPYSYVTYYLKERPKNLTFNYKYDKNSPKDMDEFIFIKQATSVKKDPNSGSATLKSAPYSSKFKVVGKVKGTGKSSGEWYEVMVDGKFGYVPVANALKREFDWHDMMKKIEKTNKFVKDSISSKQKIYVLDDYTPLGGGSGTSKDKFGNRENQSERGYTSTSFTDFINIPDRSLMTILEETDKYVKVKIDVYDGVYYLKKNSRRLLKDSGITSEITRFVYMDRSSQNEMIVEKNSNSNTWNVVTSSFVTTGKDGGSSYATPFGTFLIAISKPVMQYTGSDNKTVAGDAKWAVRFSGGGYMHGIPSLFEPKATRDSRKAATAKKIGTYSESHKCVRHYDDQIKYIYDWLGNSTPNNENGYRKPSVPTVVIVK